MKPTSMLFVLAALALGACSEPGGSQPSDQSLIDAYMSHLERSWSGKNNEEYKQKAVTERQGPEMTLSLWINRKWIGECLPCVTHVRVTDVRIAAVPDSNMNPYEGELSVEISGEEWSDFDNKCISPVVQARWNKESQSWVFVGCE